MSDREEKEFYYNCLGQKSAKCRTTWPLTARALRPPFFPTPSRPAALRLGGSFLYAFAMREFLLLQKDSATGALAQERWTLVVPDADEAYVEHLQVWSSPPKERAGRALTYYWIPEFLASGDADACRCLMSVLDTTSG
jgi:hypothetical protein